MGHVGLGSIKRELLFDSGDRNSVMIDVRNIHLDDDGRVGEIIKQVGQEFGAVGDGFGPGDAEVETMSQHYLADTGSLYLVATVDGVVVGGGGVAAFNGSQDVCELRKLFLLPGGRGLGLGRRITQDCLAFARTRGYSECYLDTLANMTAAIGLYESLGFQQLDQRLDGTIHNGCDVWMLKRL